MTSRGEELQIELSGITDISEAEIEVHFQKKKYGGGDVTVTRLEDDKAIMTIEGISPEMLERILESKHIIDSHELTLRRIVPSLPATDFSTELPPLINDSGTVVVRGFQQEVHKDMLELYFTHEKMSGGGPIDKIVTKEKEAYVVFSDQATAVRVVERGHHVIVGQKVEVQLVTCELPTGEQLHTVTSANTLLVKGLNAQYHNKSALELYFSNAIRCKGGDIAEIIIVGDNEAYITFVQPEVAAWVAEKRQHNILGQVVKVQLVSSEPATGEQLHTVTSADTLLIKGLNPQYHDKAVLELYFSNQAKCQGGNITEIIIQGTEACVIYAEPGVAAIVAEKRQHDILGHEVEVQLLVSEPATREQINDVTSVNTVLVKGLNAQCNSKSLLELYFSNEAKCGGGTITEIIVKDDEAYITYAEPEVAARVAGTRHHNLIDHEVEVQLVGTAPASKSLSFVPQATDTDTILVKGLKECHTESALKLFFTNKKKCGGGDVTKICINKESAYVSFADSKVAMRVAEKKVYKIMGYVVEVVLFTGAIEDITSDDPTSLVSDNILILDNVPSTMNDDVLLLYIDNITELDGEQNDYSIDHDNVEVVITFNVALEAGLDVIIQKISSTPFEGNVIQARRPLVLTNSILIDNLPTQKCNKELLDVYFTNKKKSGIDSYKEIKILDDNRAIVHLKSKDDMLQSLKHDHSWLGDSVTVSKCRVPMGTSSNSLYVSSTRSLNKKVTQTAFVIEVSKPLVNCLKRNTEEIKKRLSHLHAAVLVDTEANQVTISPCSGSEDREDWETNCRSVVDLYLESLITEIFSFPGEIKDAIVPVVLKIIQNQQSLHIEYNDESFTVIIVGEKIVVDKVKERLEEACDSQMIKKESVPMKDQKFWSFLCMKLDEFMTNHPKIEATLQTDENCVSIQGIKDSRIAFKKDLESLHTGMVSVKVRISKELVEFLSTPLGRTLLHQYLQGFESLVAVHFESEGVLFLLCSRRDDGIKVAQVIQGNLSFVFVPYPEVFVASLRGKEWATLKANLEESYCVSVSIVTNKIKLTGDKESLDHVSKEVQQFIEKECNVEKSIPLCEAQWRLLNTHMANKWGKVEQKLKGQSKLKFSFPDEGDKNCSIILKGEKSVVADFAKQIEDFISIICTNPPLEQARPGTVKFFYSEKGKTFIMGVEAQEKSCIQLDVLQDGDGDNDNLIGNGVSKSGNDKLGMGATKEGKIITLVKGDITEMQVDVIVNASNAELKHIGGVALAIAKKGGPIIQEESDRCTRRDGKLSDGDAIMMKEVGELPCKRLIHAVGPRWNDGSSKEEAFLKRACLEALKLARSFKTVSFPAISSGVFGFPISKCATCMIKAFIEYSKNDALSSLHEITIVVRDQHAISAFTTEMSKHLDKFHSTSTSFVKVNPVDAGVTDDFKPVRSKRTRQNVKAISREDQSIFAQFIKLYRGELLKQTADIYVNTAGESLNLRQGAVAFSFLKAGGQDLQDECTAYVRKNGTVPYGDVVVTRPGAIPCSRIIHTVGPIYNGKASEKILQGLVQKCLEVCDKLRASTIAFPALGAGNLNYPQNVVADIMVNTIAAYLKANRSTTCIKKVKLVIFMDNTYAEFNKLLSSKPSVAGSSLVQEAPDDSDDLLSAEMHLRTRAPKPVTRSSLTHYSTAEVFTAGNVRVEILQGDITEDDSDAIVNTTNEKMQLVGTGVAGAILRKGGPEMQKICDALVSQGIQLQEGKVCDTPATGSLKCSKVFHIVVPQNHKQMLGKTVASCLKRAEKLKLVSVAFPAIGTGILGYSLEEAAQGISSSIIAFGQKTNPEYVKRVRIIIFQKEMYQSFKDKFTEVTNKPGILKRMGAAVMSWFYGDASSDPIEDQQSNSDLFTESVVVPHSPTSVSKITEKSVLLMQIYAEDKQKVDKTEARLLKIIEDQFTNEMVSDELLSKLSQKQRDDLTRKAQQKHVQIIIETGADLNYIQLKGDRTDVADLKSDIQEILRQINSIESTKREAKLLQAKVKWQWLNDTDDYEDYEELPNYYIEEAYQHDKAKQFAYTRADGNSEIFNFSRMEAYDILYQVKFKIKRVDIEDLLKEVESPGKWDTMPKGVACHGVALDPKSTEYGEVKSKFEKTITPQHHISPLHTKLVYPPSGQYQIVKIERIQNPFLYAQYVAKKKTMDQHNPSTIVNERELFHGCPGDVVEKISHHGFNRSFAGKNATVYGKGVYFAHDASYSARDQYSPRDINNNKYIFLAKVLTGEFAVGSSSYVTPPPKGSNSLTLYDSVVDNVSNPSIFVIFGDAQAYPDYLITFT